MRTRAELKRSSRAGDGIDVVSYELRTEHVVVRFDGPVADVVCVTIAGILDAAVCRSFTVMLDETLRRASEGCTVFWDAEALDGVDAVARVEATRVLSAHRARIRGHALLAPNPQVRAALGIFALGGVSVSRSRVCFEAARAALVHELEQCA